jgi:hypothetical protein
MFESHEAEHQWIPTVTFQPVTLLEPFAHEKKIIVGSLLFSPHPSDQPSVPWHRAHQLSSAPRPRPVNADGSCLVVSLPFSFIILCACTAWQACMNEHPAPLPSLRHRALGSQSTRVSTAASHMLQLLPQQTRSDRGHSCTGSPIGEPRRREPARGTKGKSLDRPLGTSLSAARPPREIPSRCRLACHLTTRSAACTVRPPGSPPPPTWPLPPGSSQDHAGRTVMINMPLCNTRRGKAS